MMSLRQRFLKFTRFWKRVILFEVLIIGALLGSPFYLRYGKTGVYLLVVTLVLFVLLSIVHPFLPSIERQMGLKLLSHSEKELTTLNLEELLLLTKSVGFNQDKLREALIEKLRHNAHRPVNKTCKEIIGTILKRHREDGEPSMIRSMVGGFSEQEGRAFVVDALYKYIPSNMEHGASARRL